MCETVTRDDGDLVFALLTNADFIEAVRDDGFASVAFVDLAYHNWGHLRSAPLRSAEIPFGRMLPFNNEALQPQMPDDARERQLRTLRLRFTPPAARQPPSAPLSHPKAPVAPAARADRH